MALGRLRVLIETSRRGGPRVTQVGLTLLLLGLWVGVAAGPPSTYPLGQEEQQRLGVGLELFPALLGALESLADKASADGTLLVAVTHLGSPDSARRAAAALGAMAQIRGHPVRLISLDAEDLDDYQAAPLAGVFVASPHLEGARLRAWSERLGALVFSPFAGAVESGAVAGVHVSDQILPFVNLRQAARAGVRFRPFLLRVARRYE